MIQRLCITTPDCIRTNSVMLFLRNDKKEESTHFTSSLVHRLGKDGRSLLMQTTSLMSSYEGSVGTKSWYGNWYSSRIPATDKSPKCLFACFKADFRHSAFSKVFMSVWKKKKTLTVRFLYLPPETQRRAISQRMSPKLYMSAMMYD